jgi:hypothetical protein
MIKFTRIEAGEYTTIDGRFSIRQGYNPGTSGRIGSFAGGWLIEDKSRQTPFRSDLGKTNLLRVDTLKDARERLSTIYSNNK